MNDTVILVTSCDAYADAWPAFFDNFYRYWPDCPYSIYLQTNQLTPVFKGVNVIAIGQDQDWSSNLIETLKRIPAAKVLLLLEDFWIWQPVNTQKMGELSELLDKNIASIRLVPKPAPDEPYLSELGLIRKGSHYRVSFQAGLWRRDVLLQVLLAGESAWEAEMEGSKRSVNVSGDFLSIDRIPAENWPIRYLNAIIKRKWTPEAVKVAKERGIQLEFKHRKVCNHYDQLRRNKKFSLWVNKLTDFLNKILGEKLYKKIKKNPLLRRLIY